MPIILFIDSKVVKILNALSLGHMLPQNHIWLIFPKWMDILLAKKLVVLCVKYQINIKNLYKKIEVIWKHSLT